MSHHDGTISKVTLKNGTITSMVPDDINNIPTLSNKTFRNNLKTIVFPYETPEENIEYIRRIIAPLLSTELGDGATFEISLIDIAQNLSPTNPREVRFSTQNQNGGEFPSNPDQPQIDTSKIYPTDLVHILPAIASFLATTIQTKTGTRPNLEYFKPSQDLLGSSAKLTTIDLRNPDSPQYQYWIEKDFYTEHKNTFLNQLREIDALLTTNIASTGQQQYASVTDTLRNLATEAFLSHAETVIIPLANTLIEAAKTLRNNPSSSDVVDRDSLVFNDQLYRLTDVKLYLNEFLFTINKDFVSAPPTNSDFKRITEKLAISEFIQKNRESINALTLPNKPEVAFCTKIEERPNPNPTPQNNAPLFSVSLHKISDSFALFTDATESLNYTTDAERAQTIVTILTALLDLSTKAASFKPSFQAAAVDTSDIQDGDGGTEEDTEEQKATNIIDLLSYDEFLEITAENIFQERILSQTNLFSISGFLKTIVKTKIDQQNTLLQEQHASKTKNQSTQTAPPQLNTQEVYDWYISELNREILQAVKNSTTAREDNEILKTLKDQTTQKYIYNQQNPQDAFYQTYQQWYQFLLAELNESESSFLSQITQEALITAAITTIAALNGISLQDSDDSADDADQSEATTQPTDSQATQAEQAGVPDDKTLQALLQEYRAATGISENQLNNWQDLLNDYQTRESTGSLNSLFDSQTNYKTLQAQVNSLLLSHLKSQGITNLDQVPTQLSLQVQADLFAYIASLPPERALLLLTDPTARLQALSEMNRRLILKQLPVAQEIQQFVAQSLITRKAEVDTSLAQLLSDLGAKPDGSVSIQLTQGQSTEQALVAEMQQRMRGILALSGINPNESDSLPLSITSLNQAQIELIFGLSFAKDLSDSELAALKESLSTYFKTYYNQFIFDRNIAINQAIRDLEDSANPAKQQQAFEYLKKRNLLSTGLIANHPSLQQLSDKEGVSGVSQAALYGSLASSVGGMVGGSSLDIEAKLREGLSFGDATTRKSLLQSLSTSERAALFALLQARGDQESSILIGELEQSKQLPQKKVTADSDSPEMEYLPLWAYEVSETEIYYWRDFDATPIEEIEDGASSSSQRPSFARRAQTQELPKSKNSGNKFVNNLKKSIRNKLDPIKRAQAKAIAQARNKLLQAASRLLATLIAKLAALAKFLFTMAVKAAFAVASLATALGTFLSAALGVVGFKVIAVGALAAATAAVAAFFWEPIKSAFTSAWNALTGTSAATAATTGLATGAFVTTAFILTYQVVDDARFVLPTVNESGQLSKFISIQKVGYIDDRPVNSSGNTVLQNPLSGSITYIITIASLDPLYSLEISNLTDTFQISYTDSSKSFNPVVRTGSDLGLTGTGTTGLDTNTNGASQTNTQGALQNNDNSQQGLGGLISNQNENQSDLAPGESLDTSQTIRVEYDDEIYIIYEQELPGNVEDATIQNTFDLQVRITSLEDGSVISETATTAEIICVGECPLRSGEGCWPTSGVITQMPGGSYSHPRSDAFDIANRIGTPIYAPFSGTLTQSRNAASLLHLDWGTHYQILRDVEGKPGIMYGFGHNHPEGVVRLGPVKKGELIGYMGAEGGGTYRVTGPHLHFDRGIGPSFGNLRPDQFELENEMPGDVNGNPIVLNSWVRSYCTP